MGRFSDTEVERELLAFLEVQHAQDWDHMCDFFTADAVYVEHAMGTFVGREAIREWLVPVHGPAGGLGVPDQVAPGGRRPGRPLLGQHPAHPRRATTGTYVFSGITVLDYAGDDLWSREEDLYNEVEMQQRAAGLAGRRRAVRSGGAGLSGGRSPRPG